MKLVNYDLLKKGHTPLSNPVQPTRISFISQVQSLESGTVRRKKQDIFSRKTGISRILSPHDAKKTGKTVRIGMVGKDAFLRLHGDVLPGTRRGKVMTDQICYLGWILVPGCFIRLEDEIKLVAPVGNHKPATGWNVEHALIDRPFHLHAGTIQADF